MPYEHLDRARSRDLEGRGWAIWLTRALLVVLALVPVLALLDVFGQQPQTSAATGPAARLVITSPDQLRGGLLFATRIEVDAHRAIKHANLVFDPGWFEEMTFNGLVPQPTSQTSRDGRVVFEMGPLAAGHKLVAWISFQVNPINVGRPRQNVELDDGTTPIATVRRSVTIFP